MLRATHRLARKATRSFATVVDAAAGAKVAAVDNGQPTSSVTLLLKAGSRYEPKPGVAHVLSNFTFKSTGKRSTLGTVREAELYGGVLSSSLSREHLAVTAEFLRGDEVFFVDVLASFLASPKFARHELTEYVLPAVHAQSDAAAHSHSTRAFELAHALAFRSGLGHSLFADPDATGDITADDVRTFHTQAVSRGVAVLGTGISSQKLAELFSTSLSAHKSASTSASATPAAVYHGGSTRVSSAHGSQMLFVGFGTASAAQFPALHALTSHLSPAPVVKWGSGTSTVATALPTGVKAHTVILPYSDAALMGIIFEGADAKAVGAGAKAAMDVLKATASGKISADEAKRAVARARFAIAGAADSRDGLVSTLGPKVLSGQSAELQSAIDALTAVDTGALSKVASELLKSRPTYVAIGDMFALPYGDEIGLNNA